MFLTKCSALKYALIATGVVIGAILFQKLFYSTNTISVVKKQKVLSVKELLTYNGIQQDKLYLAVLGNVYDVTKGSKHYMKGSPYHYFIGKDGTRALVTGDFKDETQNKDEILDLSCNDLLTIVHWRKSFKQKYVYVGYLAGRYYDKNGEETFYMKEVKEKVNQCRKKKEDIKKQEKLFPPCNMAWSEEDGAKVWCTKSSGGVTRDWVGVPRQLYIPGEQKLQCVCVNLNTIDNTNLLKEYIGCSSTAPECSVVDT